MVISNNDNNDDNNETLNQNHVKKGYRIDL